MILLWLTPDNFGCQCGRIGSESVMHYLINPPIANVDFYYFTQTNARQFHPSLMPHNYTHQCGHHGGENVIHYLIKNYLITFSLPMTSIMSP